DVSSFNDGTLTVTLDAEDANGNTAAQVTDTIAKDTVADDSSVDIADSGADGVISSTDDLGHTQLSGSIEAGGRITGLTISDGSTTITLNEGGYTLLADGTWTANVDVSSFNDGTLTVTLDAEDAHGNTAAQVTDTIAKDTVADASSVTIADSGNDGVISSTDDLGHTQLSGSIEAG
ncbi:hypothetical protein MSL71_52400, partial [Desulfoluna butyratoxydans]